MGRQRKPRGRDVEGILVLDKPAGMTSNAVLQRAKWLLAAAKAGHTGSLDPMATGVLPLCFGAATRFCQYLLDADKAYRCTIRFGVVTNTADAEGEVLSSRPAPGLTRDAVESALGQFVGEIQQVPPMFSALKHQGQPLYKLAREGIEIERTPRCVKVYSLDMLDFRCGEFPEADIDVRVSKGTYIRTLAQDVGDMLGCGAHLCALRRTEAGPFYESQSVTLDELEAVRGEGRAELLDSLLLPIGSALGHLNTVSLPASSAFYLRQGQPVLEIRALQQGNAGDLVRVQGEEGEFLGVAEILSDGRLAPRKLLQANGAQQSVATTVNMHGRA